jgi:AbrB family looped-hinge helix DNA binding protein
MGMDGMYTVKMGDRGRLVVPADMRERLGLHPGRVLVFIESPTGVVLLTRDQLKDRVRSEMAGLNLVDELLEDRRRQSGDEDAA